MNRFYLFIILWICFISGMIAEHTTARRAERRELTELQGKYFTLLTNALDAQEMTRQSIDGWQATAKQRDEYRDAYIECSNARSGFKPQILTNGTAVSITNVTITYYGIPTHQTNQWWVFPTNRP